MNISEILNSECTLCSAKVTSKKKVLETLSQMLAKQCERTEQDILDSLIERERLGSTGVGNGIAIPHGRMEIENVHAALLTTESPVSFDAIDNQPVDIFFAVLVPENECQQHIKVLSSIAQKLSSKDQLKAIRIADTNDSLYSTVVAA